MNKKNVTVYYGLVMAIYSLGYVTMSAFSSLYLLDIGLSNGGVGILLAVGSLLSVLFQPAVGTMIDQNPKISSKSVMLFISTIVVIVGMLIMFLPIKNIWLSALLYGICIMLLMLGQPFLNSLGMEAINYGYPMNLGIGRSMGSMGYAIGSYLFGIVSVMAGPKSVPIAFSVAFFILTLLLHIYPVKETNNGVKNEEIVKTKSNPIIFLSKYRRFSVMLLGLILVYFSHALINTFTLQIITSKNGTSANMGTATSLAAFCELITVALFSIYMKHIKLHNIIKISSVFFTIKILFSLLVPNIITFYLIQGLQMFGWGFMSIGIVYYVNNLVGDYDKAQGQAYAGMAYTISSVIASFLGGIIIDLLGVNNMLFIGTVLAAFGTIIIYFTAEEVKQN